MKDGRKVDLDCIVLAQGTNITPQGIALWSQHLLSVILGGQCPDEPTPLEDNCEASRTQQAIAQQ